MVMRVTRTKFETSDNVACCPNGVPGTSYNPDAMKKIGLIGGLGWLSTIDYYRLLCSRTNEHFQ